MLLKNPHPLPAIIQVCLKCLRRRAILGVPRQMKSLGREPGTWREKGRWKLYVFSCVTNKGASFFVHNHQHDVHLISIFNNLTNKSSSVFSLLMCVTVLLNKKEWLTTKSLERMSHRAWEKGDRIPQGEAIAVYLWFLWLVQDTFHGWVDSVPKNT